jgi:(R)-2-hydroxyacyl-CoA dehydratese activating ATPase
VTRSIGIDIGSSYSKGVIIDDLEVLAWHVLISGSDYRVVAGAIRAELLREAGLREDDIARTTATGCGADTVAFAQRKASDMVCTARGINRLFPQARTAIDVGSQSGRVIKLSLDGAVTNFAVTEKCAAGGGRFMEVIASVLRVDLAGFGALAARSKDPVTFSTGCAVFGETEAITRISEGIAGADIAAGVNRALAGKIASLVKKVQLEEPCAICGGGALSTSLVRAVEAELGCGLLVPPQPQLVAALGAAIIASGGRSPT